MASLKDVLDLIIRKKKITEEVDTLAQDVTDENKIIVGSMGSGKSYTACIFAQQFLNSGGAVVGYDPLKGGSDMKMFLSSNYTRVIDNIDEEIFFDACEKWIDNNSSGDSGFNRLLGDDPIKTLFIIEEFHFIKNINRVYDLIKKGLENNCYFYLITQRVYSQHIRNTNLDQLKINILIHRASNSDIHVLGLQGKVSVSDFENYVRGLYYSEKLDRFRRLDSNRLKDGIKMPQINPSIVKRLERFL